MTKAMVIYSGGADSYTTLMHVIDAGIEVEAVSVDYGQRHSIELEYAKAVCEELGIHHHIVDLRSLRDLLSNSALTSDMEMPTGHYQAEHMRQTVVPNRNAILINVAAGIALNREIYHLYTGVHAGDHYIYPDCRPEFIARQAAVLTISMERPVQLMAPFVNVDKAELMRRGVQLGLDYGKAWTCYDPQTVEGQVVACGKCGACVERKESVEASGATDSMVYADV